MSLLRLLIHTEAASYKMKVESSINYYPNILNYIPRNPSNYSLIILLMGSHDPDRADTSLQSHYQQLSASHSMFIWQEVIFIMTWMWNYCHILVHKDTLTSGGRKHFRVCTCRANSSKTKLNKIFYLSNSTSVYSAVDALCSVKFPPLESIYWRCQ